jgi:hypothetical protein
MWIAGTADGKIQILLGSAAVKERRRVGREIDDTIARALRGDLREGELGTLQRLAALADLVARGKPA